MTLALRGERIMSLYVIAEIVRNGSDTYQTERVGYRIFDNRTMRYIDASKESIIEKLNSGVVVNGMTLSDSRKNIELTYGQMHMNKYTLDLIAHEGETPSWFKKNLWTVIFKSNEGVMAVSSGGTTKLISYDSIRYSTVNIRLTNLFMDVLNYTGFEIEELGHIDSRQLNFKRSERVRNVVDRLEMLENNVYTVDYDGTFLLLNKDAKHISIPSVCKRVPERTFECSQIESIKFGSGVVSLGSRAFTDCRKLTSLVIPGNVKRIGTSCFTGCSSLSSVVLHDGVERIHRAAFGYCSNLKYIKLPRTLKGKINLPNILQGIYGVICVDIPTELKGSIVPFVRNSAKGIPQLTDIRVRFY